MVHRVVCISRVTAAGGEAVGRLVAAELGFRYVDEEVIELAAAAAGLDPAVLERAEQHRGVLTRMMDALIAQPAEAEGYFKASDRGYYAEGVKPSMVPPADQLRGLIQHAIVEIAHHGNAVIVSHAASLALAGQTDVLRVHVLASVATRVRRLWLTNMIVSEEEYAKAIAESDYNREKYLARFYGVRDEDPTRYDLVINTDVLQVDQAVAAVVAAATTEVASR